MKEILYLCSVFIKLVYRMDAKKILFIAQEITPYLPESEIATICRNLPQGIQERGREIRTFMPKFGSINERRNQLHEVIRLSGMNLIIDDTDHPLIIKVASIQAARMYTSLTMKISSKESILSTMMMETNTRITMTVRSSTFVVYWKQ